MKLNVEACLKSCSIYGLQNIKLLTLGNMSDYEQQNEINDYQFLAHTNTNTQTCILKGLEACMPVHTHAYTHAHTINVWFLFLDRGKNKSFSWHWLSNNQQYF